MVSRTYVGQTRIGRNDPCYCGNTKPLVVNGVVQTICKGKPIVLPVKFKNCCYAKHAVYNGMTPALAEHIKKKDVYFKKTGKVV